MVVDVVLPAVLGLVLVGEAGIEACVRRSFVSRPYRISGAAKAILAGGAGRRASPGVAYQLCGGRLAINSRDCGVAGKAHQ